MFFVITPIAFFRGYTLTDVFDDARAFADLLRGECTHPLNAGAADFKGLLKHYLDALFQNNFDCVTQLFANRFAQICFDGEHLAAVSERHER